MTHILAIGHTARESATRRVFSNLDIGRGALDDSCVEQGDHRVDLVARARARVCAEQGSSERCLGYRELRRSHFKRRANIWRWRFSKFCILRRSRLLDRTGGIANMVSQLRGCDNALRGEGDVCLASQAICTYPIPSISQRNFPNRVPIVQHRKENNGSAADYIWHVSLHLTLSQFQIDRQSLSGIANFSFSLAHDHDMLYTQLATRAR